MALAARRSPRDTIHWANLVAKEPDGRVGPLAERIIEKVCAYEDFLKNSGLIYLWKRCWLGYLQGVVNNRMESVGEQEEYTRIKINHFRNLLRHIFVNVTSTKPTMSPRATNTSFKSRSQVQICDGMLDYYMIEKGIEGKINTATECAIVCGEGYNAPTWDPAAGRIVAMSEPELQPDGSQLSPETPIYEGDIRVDTPRPWDVIRDTSKESFEELEWLIVRRFVNRFDLIAAHPDLRDKILSLPDKWSAREGGWTARGIFEVLKKTDKESSDDVAVYTLYHKRTPAVPLGRVTTVLDAETVLSDEAFKQAGCDEIPVYRVCAGDMEGLPFGFTPAFDLLAPQEGVNLLHSTITTNNAAFGVQCLQAAAGTSVNVQHLSNGMVLIERPPGAENRIEPVQLTKTAAETFTYKNELTTDMQVISGVNSVERGQPDAQLKSGVALALVEAQALEFQGDLRQSRAGLISKNGTAIVRLFKSKVKVPRLAAIAGKENRAHLKALKGADIADIDNVVVEEGSPLIATRSGRVNLADQLIKLELVETPEQLLSVITTGKIEPLTKGPQATLDLIQLENEMLMRGEVPDVQLTDKHHLHIVEHAVVMADPEVRKDANIKAAHDEHQRRHLAILAAMPPELAAILGMPVLQQPGAAPPGGAPGDEAGLGGAGQVLDAANPVDGELGQVQALGAPRNPVSGAEMPIEGGLQ